MCSTGNSTKYAVIMCKGGLAGGSVLKKKKTKNLPANSGDAGDSGLIPGLGRSPEKEMTTHSNIFA